MWNLCSTIHQEIIEKLAEKREDIEEISIEPREATEYRKFLQITLGENTGNNTEKEPNKQGNPVKRIHTNWIYFRDLEKRIKHYPKIDKIELENEDQGKQVLSLPKSIEKIKIEHMST